ncbi:MAG: hypothetical protein IKM59_07210, partial [Oscillospiraceae bacterium]|nr:hypothetical protein [Oscillospiraceae bacterium]
LPRLRQGEPAYELRGTQICEVGDGMTVSGFVVRQEHLLFAPEQPDFLPAEGQWVSGGQAVALLTHGRLTAPRSGYLSYITDGY